MLVIVESGLIKACDEIVVNVRIILLGGLNKTLMRKFLRDLLRHLRHDLLDDLLHNIRIDRRRRGLRRCSGRLQWRL